MIAPVRQPLPDAPAAACRHHVTDQFLIDMSQPSPLRSRGELTAIEQAQLASALPDIFAELLAYRRAARRPANPAPDAGTGAQLYLAYSVIRAAPPMPNAMVENACQIILTHSHSPCEIMAAQEVLKSMQRQAA